MTGGRAVILGEIGKNFAAGMSGGIAYIYDKEDSLANRINKEMVDLEKIQSEDEGEVKEMILKYIKHTSSKEAQEIIDNWESQKDKFIKVMPRDYKKALAELKKEA
jgi:glutamate synthase domain-containing protein 3